MNTEPWIEGIQLLGGKPVNKVKEMDIRVLERDLGR